MIDRMYEMGQVSVVLNLFKYPCYMRNLCIYLHVLCYVHLLSHVQLFVTPCTATRQASLSSTNSQSLFKLTSIESMMPCNHLILYHPFLLLPSVFPSIKIFANESALCSGGQNIEASISASDFPMNIQD